MTLVYSAHEPNGQVIVWQDNEPYADLSDTPAAFEAKVLRAREIVESVNAAPSVEQTESAVREASERQRREAGLE